MNIKKLFIQFFFFLFSFFLSSQLLAHSYKYYVVKRGDSLYKIAKKYKISIGELKRINNLHSNLIKAGQVLKIPLNDKVIEECVKEYYIVKKGDSLYKIAKRYGISVKKLKRINGLRSNLIRPGQKLLVKIGKKKRINKKYIIHKVREGETLYIISLEYNISAEEIKKVNNIKDNVVIVGQKLKIPLKKDIEPFILQNPLFIYGNFTEKLLSQKFSINFLSKSILSKKDELLLKEKFLEIAKRYKNYRYKYGGNGRGKLDCSMFVKLVYKNLGIDLPRTSREQFKVGIEVDKDELIPGDLVFFSRYKSKKRVTHVGIYIGDRKFIHFSSSKKGLAISSLDKAYFKRRFVGAKRILNGEILKYLYFSKYLKYLSTF